MNRAESRSGGVNGWTWHEEMWSDREIPRPQHGHGSFSETKDESDTGFKLDAESGLFLPETVSKERRKVTIGFHVEDA